MFSIFGKDSFSSISVNDLKDKLEKINLIDVRENYEYKRGHVPTAKNIPMSTLLANPERYLNKSKIYHMICQSGERSSRTCKKLSLLGYDVVDILGGTGSYTQALQE